MEIDQEVRARLEIEKHGLDAGRELEIRTDINNKHSAKKKMLLAGWQRAKDENELIHKQKDYRKYQKLFHQYAYPLGNFKFRVGESKTFASIETT